MKRNCARRIAAFCLTIALLLAFVPAVSAADSGTFGASGDNLSWSLDDSGLLTISGTGEMGLFKTPWYDDQLQIKRVVIESGVTNIGYGAFSGCRNLESVTIPYGIITIGTGAFNECYALTSVTLPESVTTIEERAFQYCGNMASLTLPQDLKTIGVEAFAYCYALTEFTVPASVTSLGAGAFDSCYGLTEIGVASGNTSYRSEDGVVFTADMKQLCAYPSGRSGAYTVPDGVTGIGGSAFIHSLLGEITIPDTVTSVGDSAFELCYDLTDVYFLGTEAQWNAISIGSNNSYLLDATIHYGSAAPKDQTLPTAYRYVPYSERLSLQAADDSVALVSGSLPAGLSLSADGTVSGMATELGGFEFKVRETGGGSSWEYTVTMFVYAQTGTDVEAFNQPGYGFVETETDDGHVQDQTVASREELTDQTMHCEADYYRFVALYIDAVELTRDKDYTAEEGSTKITITAETIGAVGGGTHTIAAEFKSGNGQSIFTVQNYTIAGIASREVHVQVKGTLIVWTDSEPYIDTNSRTMTPFRAVGEALGLTAGWDGSTREASFTDGKRTIYFPIGNNVARTSDGGTVQMDTSAVIVNGRTYAPVRYLAEFFGYTVDWDGVSRTVIVK